MHTAILYPMKTPFGKSGQAGQRPKVLLRGGRVQTANGACEDGRSGVESSPTHFGSRRIAQSMRMGHNITHRNIWDYMEPKGHFFGIEEKYVQQLLWSRHFEGFVPRTNYGGDVRQWIGLISNQIALVFREAF